MSTTTTSTTTRPPPLLSEIIALVPNPDTMSVCEELSGGVVTFRQKVVDFITAFMTEDGAPGGWFKGFVCPITCPTTTTTTTLPP